MAAAQSLLLQQQIHGGKPHFFRRLSPPLNTFSSVNFNCVPTKSFRNLSVKYSLLLNNSSNGVNNFASAASGGNRRGGEETWAPLSSSRNKRSSLNNHCSSAAVSSGVGIVCVIFWGITALLLLLPLSAAYVEISEKRTSVLKLQVGLSGMDTSLHKDLNRINTSASTSLNSKLTDTVLALLRYSDNCISAYLSIDVKGDKFFGEKIFCQKSFEERCKLDEETLIDVINIKERSSTTLRSSGLNNKHMVVTILVHVQRKYMLPRIQNSDDLKEALKKLGSLPISSILGVEVLWTPQKEDDTLSEEELVVKYPLLQPL